MDKEKLAVGQKVKAKVEEDLKQPFSGTIEKKFMKTQFCLRLLIMKKKMTTTLSN